MCLYGRGRYARLRFQRIIMLDALLEIIKLDSLTPNVLCTAMSDAQHRGHEMKILALGNSLAQWNICAKQPSTDSEDIPVVLSALGMAMSSRIWRIDSAILQADRSLLCTCQQLSDCRETTSW